MGDTERWVARVRPTPLLTVESLLSMPLGLDVWERGGDDLVVTASEAQLSALEDRRLASVERLSTVAAWKARAEAQADRAADSDEHRRRT